MPLSHCNSIFSYSNIWHLKQLIITKTYPITLPYVSLGISEEKSIITHKVGIISYLCITCELLFSEHLFLKYFT